MMLDLQYIDQYNMVTPAADMIMSDNGPLYTAQAYLLGFDISLRPIASCVQNGKFLRRPDDNDQTSPDNILAMSLIIPNTLYNYGKRHFWIYNSSVSGKFTVRAWMGRQPGLIGMIKHMSGHWSPISQFIWNVGVYITMVSKTVDAQGHLETSDRLLVETTFLSETSRSYTYKWLQQVWRKRINKDFTLNTGLSGTGLDEMVYLYFGEKHPFYGVWK